jgi:hypothetical protein
MVFLQRLIRDPFSHLLFPTINKLNISVGELVIVSLFEGKDIAGVIDEICDDKEHFWLRSSKDPNSNRQRFSFRIDKVVKLN